MRCLHFLDVYHVLLLELLNLRLQLAHLITRIRRQHLNLVLQVLDLRLKPLYMLLESTLFIHCLLLSVLQGLFKLLDPLLQLSDLSVPLIELVLHGA